MTPEEIHDLTENIIQDIEMGASIASVVSPHAAALLLIGRAMDKAIPDLAQNVASWIQVRKPTAEELDQFRKQLNVLLDPNNP